MASTIDRVPVSRGSNPSTCEDCDQRFTTRPDAVNHARVTGHMANRYCQPCRKLFDSPKALSQHESNSPEHGAVDGSTSASAQPSATRGFVLPVRSPASEKRPRHRQKSVSHGNESKLASQAATPAGLLTSPPPAKKRARKRDYSDPPLTPGVMILPAAALAGPSGRETSTQMALGESLPITGMNSLPRTETVDIVDTAREHDAKDTGTKNVGQHNLSYPPIPSIHVHSILCSRQMRCIWYESCDAFPSRNIN
jgi:hypothetical protein